MQLTFSETTFDDTEALTLLSLQFGYNVSVKEMQHRIAQVLAREDHGGFAAVAGEQVVGWSRKLLWRLGAW